MDQVRTITSRDNARLVHVRKVRDGKIRDEIYVEGLRLSEELIRSDLQVLQGFITAEFADEARGRQIVEHLLQAGVTVHQVPETNFRSIADTVQPQGVILLAERPRSDRERVIDALSSTESGLLVYLYRINDPSNLGAIFRTAEAAGVSAIILSEGSANVFSPKSVRAAMGASFRVPIWETAPLNETIDLAREHGIGVFAADISGRKAYTELDWGRPAMVVFGSEATGLPPEILSQVDDDFVIPMKNNVESLNLAVSCGIVLFEAARQRALLDGK